MTNTIILEKVREIKNEILDAVMQKMDEIVQKSSDIKMTDLKIHEASYFIHTKVSELGLSDNDLQSLFEHICEMEYEYFQEFEEKLDYVKREYIGRTSSFYYNSDWYGTHIDNDYVSDILEGKGELHSLFDYLTMDVYNALFDDENIHDDLDMDDLEEAEEHLNDLYDDLEVLESIVDEALSVYEYLKEYKTEENETSLVLDYLECDIENHLAENKADELFEAILDNIEKLNLVKSINLEFLNVNNEYMLKVNVNNTIFELDTDIKCNAPHAEKYIESIMYYLEQSLQNSFAL